MDNEVPPFSLEDIHAFLTGTTIDVPNIVVHVDSLRERDYNLDAIFQGNFSLVLFLPNPLQEVGHFVLLTQLSEHTLEYFDSYAQPVPEPVRELAKANGMRVLTNKTRLQEKTSNTCAKWCIARLFSLPNSLDRFVSLYTGHKTLSPDVMVNNVFVLKKRE